MPIQEAFHRMFLALLITALSFPCFLSPFLAKGLGTMERVLPLQCKKVCAKIAPPRCGLHAVSF